MSVDIRNQIDPTWFEPLQSICAAPWFEDLSAFVQREREHTTVFPPKGQVFTALKETPLDQVRVVVIGQDPYHGPGQAHGLSFSVPAGVGLPPSLRNIYRELQSDLGEVPPPNGSLLPWAHQGVLLLNAVLTVRSGTPGSHQGKGWERFTDAIIQLLWEGSRPIAFVTWGKFAAETLRRAQSHRAGAAHLVVASAHPSPLSAHAGFLGSRPFSKINHWLEHLGQQPIQWGSGSVAGRGASLK